RRVETAMEAGAEQHPEQHRLSQRADDPRPLAEKAEQLARRQRPDRQPEGIADFGFRILELRRHRYRCPRSSPVTLHSAHSSTSPLLDLATDSLDQELGCTWPLYGPPVLLVPEPVAGAFDEDVFERGLAERDRRNLGTERVHQPAEEFMSALRLDA